MQLSTGDVGVLLLADDMVVMAESVEDVREWSGCLARSPGMVERSSQMSGSYWEALLDVREFSGVLHGCPGVVGMPSQLSGSSERPSRMSGSG